MDWKTSLQLVITNLDKKMKKYIALLFRIYERKNQDQLILTSKGFTQVAFALMQGTSTPPLENQNVQTAILCLYIPSLTIALLLFFPSKQLNGASISLNLGRHQNYQRTSDGNWARGRTSADWVVTYSDGQEDIRSHDFSFRPLIYELLTLHRVGQKFCISITIRSYDFSFGPIFMKFLKLYRMSWELYIFQF